MAAIVVAFVERLAERQELDLEACGGVPRPDRGAARAEGAHALPRRGGRARRAEPEEAAEELARRLAEYRRMKEAAALARSGSRASATASSAPARAACAAARAPARAPRSRAARERTAAPLAEPPPEVSLSHMAPCSPVSQFLERFRAVLRWRRLFDFDAEVGELPRVDQAVAFLALLELRKTGEVALEQAAPFAPIRASRSRRDHLAGGALPAEPGSAAVDGADAAPAGGPYRRTVPPAYASSATPHKPTVEPGQDSSSPDERTSAWIVRSA